MEYSNYLEYANYLKSIYNISSIPADVCNIICKYVIDEKTIFNNLRLTIKNGHLEVVKYLVLTFSKKVSKKGASPPAGQIFKLKIIVQLGGLRQRVI